MNDVQKVKGQYRKFKVIHKVVRDMPNESLI